MIEIQNVTVQFSDKKVLDDISINFEQGGAYRACRAKWYGEVYIDECYYELLTAYTWKSTI